MLSLEQANAIRKQLMHHIDSTFPQDKKEFAKAQLMRMDDSQLEGFLRQNKMIQESESEEKKSIPKRQKLPKKTKIPPISTNPASHAKCVFCSIILKKLPAFRLDENKHAIAVLEINPISKGHVLIIPKEHIESTGKIPQGVFALAKKLSKKIKRKLKPLDVQIHSSNVLGHEIINVLPVYKQETIDSPRHQEDKEKLKKLQKRLEKKPSKKKPKKIEEKQKKEAPKSQDKIVIKEERILIPRRIP